MLLYLAGYSVSKDIHKIPKESGLLESYLYFKKKDYYAWHKDRNLLDRKLFLDSGAFSAFTRGEVINIDEYIRFIKKFESCFEVYACLDVIGDWEATKKNQEYMEKMGLNPLPTFHYGSPLTELERLIERYNYIALGGLVPLMGSNNKLVPWLNKCFSIILKKKGMKIHGFGVGNYNTWKKYPFYSVDATSWVMGGKFRRITFFRDNKMIFFNKKSKGSIEGLNCWCKGYEDLNLNNALEYTKAATFITKVWEKRGIVWD